jgi:hypothetical protein
LFKNAARLIDHGPVRWVLVVFAIVLGLPLFLMSGYFLSTASTEPLLSLFGFAGVFGLVGAWVRLSLGPSFMHRTRLLRALVALSLAVGTLFAILAALSLSRFGLWSWLMCAVAAIGFTLFIGSVQSAAARPNTSFKVTPDGAPQLDR